MIYGTFGDDRAPKIVIYVCDSGGSEMGGKNRQNNVVKRYSGCRQQ